MRRSAVDFRAAGGCFSREKTGGKKSLDDFARAFFGINDGSYVAAYRERLYHTRIRPTHPLTIQF